MTDGGGGGGTGDLRVQREVGGGGGTGDPDPLKNHKTLGYLSNTGLDPL